MNGSLPGRSPAHLLLVAAVAAAGCGIHYQLPANRFDSPEAQGRAFAGHAAPLVISRTHEVVVADNYTLQPPDTSSRIAEPSFPLGFGVGLGVARAVDVELRKVAGGSTMAAVKVQLVGEPETDAKAGNVAVAFVGGAGGGQRGGSGENVFSGVRSSWEMTSRVWEVAVVGGYRINSYSLVYGGPSYTDVAIDGAVTQPEGSATKYRFEGTGRQAAFDLGVQLKWRSLELKADLAVARIAYADDAKTTLSAGVLAGIDW